MRSRLFVFATIGELVLLAAACLLAGCDGAGRAQPHGSFAAGHTEKSTENTDQSISGIFLGKEGKTSVEVEIANNRIVHIELIEHEGSSLFEKKAINVFDVIVWKNSVEAAEYDPETVELIAAIRSAIRAAGLSPEDFKGTARRPTSKEPETEYRADLVIVGAGCAGLCAAIEARDLGIENVIILEKMSFGGGNTRMSNGCYGAPGNWLQKKAGIKDDGPDRFFKDIYDGAYRTGSPELIRILAESALDDALWLRDTIGVKFQDELTWYEGHSRIRTLRAVGEGYRFADTLISAAEKRSVHIHYTTRAVRLLTDEGGNVFGVEAERGGKKVRYESACGVILSSGGFGANVQMRQAHNSRWGNLDASVLTSNSPGSTGDGIVLAQEAGAALVDMDYIQLYPVNNPATGNLYLLDYARLNDTALLLNREGRRFVNERATRDVIAATTIKQTGGTVYELIDQRTIRRMKLEELYGAEIERCMDQGVLVKGSIETCASFFGLPMDSVTETIRRFNSLVANGRDTDYGRDDLKPIDGGPYIMFSSVVSVHHTMGGVKIDRDAHVLDTNGKRIPGLFAAGEVTGGIHGVNRLGSAALVDGVVFGRIAARSAARSTSRAIVDTDR